MYTQEDKQSFLDLVKQPCIEACASAGILPSVITAIAISSTKWGTSKLFNRANNLFCMLIDDNWMGECYSLDSGRIYPSKSEIDEMSAILYKAYGEPMESLNDFLTFLHDARRSKNGPRRYTHLFEDGDYKKIINNLAAAEFASEYMHQGANSYLWYDDIIGIIETNKLYEWDNEMEEIIMGKKNKAKLELRVKDNEPIEFKPVEHMYRVRLDWDKPDTQIFASPNYDDAKEVALQHEGYKIYIDDDGELFEDPWDIPEPESKTVDIPGVHNVMHPHPGHPVILNNTLVYKNAIDKASYMCLSGTFYFYDNTVVNGRVKITTHKNIIKPDPSLILGYIKID